MRRRYKIAFILLALLHIIITPLVVNLAYAERGFMGIGGEYLVFPVIALIIYAALDRIEVREDKGEI